MHKVTVYDSDNKKIMWAEDGELLSKLLENNTDLEHPCGGRGVCGKCTVIINGEETLSCKYEVKGDIDVKIPFKGKIATADAGEETNRITEKVCLCFDIGTTTLALALVSAEEKKIIRTVTGNNPQRVFAADVMSRIDYASKNGTEKLQKVLINELNSMIEELCDRRVDTMFVAGNTTMLHLFFGIDPSGMGYAPYESAFLDKKKMPAENLGIINVGEVVSLPCISSFVGADIVSGLGYTMFSENGKYNLLIDLGTNAEVVLYSKNALYCTAAAAGPCFEGVNISCGMSAVEGAVYSYTGNMCLTVGNCEPKGLCATGLIDVVALLLEWGFLDESGFLEEDFEIAKGVTITQEDIRQYQLAKAAICAAVEALVKKARISFEDIDKVYVAGGFSSKMNLGNAIRTGLLPREVIGKFCPINNSCLKGLVKYACEKNDFGMFLKNAEYVDLAKDEYFQDLFIEKMGFE